MWHLNNKYPNYDEFREKTVLEYIKSLCKSTAVMFVYISIAENVILDIIKKHVKDRELDITLGRIVESSSCPISNVITRFKQISG